jgi:tRNA A-37 threonylcarbamoyl transferase component Bud32
MNDRTARERLEQLLAGRLTEPDRRSVLAHVANCPDCRQWMRDHSGASPGQAPGSFGSLTSDPHRAEAGTLAGMHADLGVSTRTQHDAAQGASAEAMQQLETAVPFAQSEGCRPPPPMTLAAHWPTQDGAPPAPTITEPPRDPMYSEAERLPGTLVSTDPTPFLDRNEGMRTKFDLNSRATRLPATDAPSGSPETLAASGTDLLAPQWQPSEYEILGQLGRGGMGVVYKARHLKLNRLVALKMILDGGQNDPDQVARFRTEAEAIARFRHPNIVQIYDIGEHLGPPYVSLELLEGGTLANRLAGTPQRAPAAAALMATLASAMEAAHQAGIVHRDLKPANIMFTADGVPRIADFGLAKRLEAEEGQTLSGGADFLGSGCRTGRVRMCDHDHDPDPAAASLETVERKPSRLAEPQCFVPYCSFIAHRIRLDGLPRRAVGPTR